MLIGRYGSRGVGTGLALLGVGATVLVGATLSASTAPGLQLSVLVLLAGVAFNGMQSFVYAIGAHSYPTYVRAPGSLRADHFAHRWRARRPGGRRVLWAASAAAGQRFFLRRRRTGHRTGPQLLPAAHSHPT